MDQNEFFMLEALKLAEISYENNDIPIGCVVVYNNKIVGLALSTCNYINKIYILCGYIPGNIKRKLAQKRKNK